MRNKSEKLRCRTCGVEHANPKLCESYRYCHRCHKVVREPKDTKLDPEMMQSKKIYIIAASYGHPVDATQAIDVTKILQDMVDANEHENFLVVDKYTDLTNLFHENPAPGICKALRIRYHMCARSGEIYLEESSEGHLGSNYILTVPEEAPHLRIYKALYGQLEGNEGNSTTYYDITEQLIGWADDLGSNYLKIPTSTNLSKAFGDPSPGKSKQLRIHYEVSGRSSKARQYESNGHLLKKLTIQATPVVAPLLIIDSAYYGFSDHDIQKRMNELRTKLQELKIIQTRKDAKMAISSEENKKLWSRDDLEKELDFVGSFSKTEFDIKEKLQQLIDQGNGDVLDLSTETNMNQLFGDPCPGYEKFIEIHYRVTGLGKSHFGSELTPTGHPRNFVTRRIEKERKSVAVEGGLMKSIHLVATPVFPPLAITRASFGHPTDLFKTFDVTSPIGIMSLRQGGKILEIPRSVDLVKEFGEPCRGVRKALTIHYDIRGLEGEMIYNCDEGHLPGTLRIGYPNHSKDSGVRGRLGFIERCCSTQGSRQSHSKWSRGTSTIRPSRESSRSKSAGGNSRHGSRSSVRVGSRTGSRAHTSNNRTSSRENIVSRGNMLPPVQ